MSLLRARAIYLLGILISVGVIIAAFIMERTMGLTPCPLCVLQRIAFGMVAIIFIIALIHNPKKTGSRIYAIIGFIFSVMGAALAGRQVWLQHHQGLQESCLPGLHMMLQSMPLHKVIATILQGTPDCSAIKWTFLGLSMAGWSLVTFMFLALMWLYVALFSHKFKRTKKMN